MKEVIFGLIGAIGFIALCATIPIMGGLTFQQRCAKAGFVGAAHERCAMRLAAGKPLFPENEAYRP